MLTVDFDRLGVRRLGVRRFVGPGPRDPLVVLDVGCGGGRHAFEAWRRGATVVALDAEEVELKRVAVTVGAMVDAGELASTAPGGPTLGDARALCFPDATFDVVVVAEVLEHVADDRSAIAELVRVLKPGGRLAVTVPTRWPEQICWALDHRYHDRPGGHVRIYRQDDLEAKLEAGGLWRRGSHHAHALHSPYWWLRCAYGVDTADDAWPVRRYHDLLAWQITTRPRWLERLERTLDPVLGKSLVVYAEKPR